MDFKLIKKDNGSKARLGELTTAHGKILTPIFMPVGTAATVKGIHQHEVDEKFGIKRPIHIDHIVCF